MSILDRFNMINAPTLYAVEGAPSSCLKIGVWHQIFLRLNVVLANGLKRAAPVSATFQTWLS
ncbi:hypothetical protein F442_05943 [Phytophthora nicotianae P10297]|uniref:Uncharacterized protein n=1 Tax=Phytophthora nicotianae P10297 TaxID=1317064 RepID=W2ZQ07_PHYNI|nr:hypothetical protein F442_05943 [Phytophthora nicotianae P10297]